LATSALHCRGIEQVKKIMQGRTTVLAGQSGVGKSTLLNALEKGLHLQTGSISRKLRTGRHTTRQVQLFPLTGGGYVADTPGFNRLNLRELSSEELDLYFPEIRDFSALCRFKDCFHVSEPGCAVVAAKSSGEVDPLRYQHYLEMLEEIRELERKY